MFSDGSVAEWLEHWPNKEGFRLSLQAVFFKIFLFFNGLKKLKKPKNIFKKFLRFQLNFF